MLCSVSFFLLVCICVMFSWVLPCWLHFFFVSTASHTRVQVNYCGKEENSSFAYTRNTTFASYMGLPSLTIPVGVAKDDAAFQIGMELVGPAHSEQTLFSLAKLVQSAWSTATCHSR